MGQLGGGLNCSIVNDMVEAFINRCVVEVSFRSSSVKVYCKGLAEAIGGILILLLRLFRVY